MAYRTCNDAPAFPQAEPERRRSSAWADPLAPAWGETARDRGDVRDASVDSDDHELDAVVPVLELVVLAAGRTPPLVREGRDSQPRFGRAQAFQVACNGGGAPFGQPPVLFGRAPGVGVTFDQEHGIRVLP